MKATDYLRQSEINLEANAVDYAFDVPKVVELYQSVRKLVKEEAVLTDTQQANIYFTILECVEERNVSRLTAMQIATRINTCN